MPEEEVKTEEKVDEVKIEEVKVEEKVEEKTEDDPLPEWAPDWAKKRIGKLTAINTAKQRENDELRAKLADQAPKAEEKPKEDVKTVEQRAEEIAEQKLANRDFNLRADAVYDKGKAEFPDWQKAVETLVDVGVVGPGVDTTFLRTITKLGDAHKVLHHLAKNPEVASSLVGLPVEDLAMSLKEIEIDLKQPVKKDVSSLPNPITPVSPKSKPAFSLEDPDSPIDEWMKKRNETARKRW